MRPVNYVTDDANVIATYWKTASRQVVCQTLQRYCHDASITQKLELAYKLAKLYKLTDEVNLLVANYERMNNA